MKTSGLCWLVPSWLLTATSVCALPVSSVDNANAVAQLYESDGQGNPTERPPALVLPFNPIAGYLVINEKGTDQASQQDERTGGSWRSLTKRVLKCGNRRWTVVLNLPHAGKCRPLRELRRSERDQG